MRWIVLPQICICSVNIELIAKGSCVLLCWNTQYTCIPEDCTYNQHRTCHFLWRQRMMFLPHSSSHFGQKNYCLLIYFQVMNTSMNPLPLQKQIMLFLSFFFFGGIVDWLSLGCSWQHVCVSLNKLKYLAVFWVVGQWFWSCYMYSVCFSCW